MAGQIFSPLAHWVGGAGALQDNGGQKVPLPGILGRMGAEPPTSAGYTSLTAFWAGHTGAEFVTPSRFILSPSNLALSGTGTLAGTLVFNYILDLDPGVELSPTGTLTLSGSVTFTSFASLAGYRGLLGFWGGGASAYYPLTLSASELALSGTGGFDVDLRYRAPGPVRPETGAGSRRRRRRAYVATHKGRDFVFETMEEAQAFLDSVREVKKKRGRPAKPKIVNIPVTEVETTTYEKPPELSIIVPKRYFSATEAAIALAKLREEAEDEEEILILLGLI